MSAENLGFFYPIVPVSAFMNYAANTSVNSIDSSYVRAKFNLAITAK